MISTTKMWNCVPFAHTLPFTMGPNKPQKRDFGFNLPSTLQIAPGKQFTNPNFVNKHYPNVHNHHYNNHHATPKIHIDNEDKITNPSTVDSSNSMLIDKSTDVVDHTAYHEIKQDMYKKSKRSRRNRKRKSSQKKMDSNRSDMDINLNGTSESYMEVDDSRESSDNIKTDTNPEKISDISSYGTPSTGVLSASILSCSPPFRPIMRERQISVADSEDSFIVFQSGTDEELVFSESEDDSDNQYEENYESTVGEDLNSSTDIPCKKMSLFSNIASGFLIHNKIGS
ncbi:unnamed protein product [Acanthoscelides obtectus]|uniref:Uncharacterized protein n=1 Tax=Acanthoscelides obtectus TaxID=200917 RepID=A0A9P0LFW2_ACAOB|nr:unnamed protein product [Acanthoscelides obtectus]CAK1638673.1 hypothetical protein AOBTE_LOCUS10748 [Acanthoscelides obtectus]